MPKPCTTHDIPDGACYCIQCGAKVERHERRVLGYLFTDEGRVPVFEYSKETWGDPCFIVLMPEVEVYE